MDDLKNIMKEGYLEKESKFLKSWRRYLHSLISDVGSFLQPPHYTPLKTKNNTGTQQKLFP